MIVKTGNMKRLRDGVSAYDPLPSIYKAVLPSSFLYEAAPRKLYKTIAMGSYKDINKKGKLVRL